MERTQTDSTMVPRRDAAQIMRLERLGSFHQSRLSFMRILMRRMKCENWTFSRPVFDINAKGEGVAVFCAKGPERTYSLVAFAHDLPPEKRSDRVIAEAWDATFTLFDGIPDADDIARLARNVPLQEAGRVTAREISVSRANRSVRLWEDVVGALADGRQPDPAQIADVGYLMRTTAVYGSGKLGAADREDIADRPEFAAPFQAEMLSVYLTRWFVRDLVQHMAYQRGGAQAVQLDPTIARTLGIGNSTGLGMAPFIVNHPVLFNNWIMAREEAIARVRSLSRASVDEIALFRDLLARSVLSVSRWRSSHPRQMEKNKCLGRDLDRLARHVETLDLTCEAPWDCLYTWAAGAVGVDAQECLASLILEPYGDLVDGLADCMASDESAFHWIRGDMPIARLRDVLQDCYGWALGLDWDAREHCARAWYVSEEKLEPRLGERFEEPIEPYEQPLAPGRDACRLYRALQDWPATATVAEFVLRHPEHRHSVRRAQIVARVPYAEIRDNTIACDVLPIDMLRCKLSFFGAVHFDPRSDRWVRICMFPNAPYPDELSEGDAEFWAYPVADQV